MTASQVDYGNVHAWVKSFLNGTHRTVLSTVAWVILCLLVAQRLNPAALARAIPAEEPGSGRSRLRRAQRWWSGPDLSRETLTPRLIRAALALLPTSGVIITALDTTRVGAWEIWQAGIVFAGHTLPVAWAVMPYPWPKGRFRETTLALVTQLGTAFPPGHRWVLVADRGFPSVALFAQLLAQKTEWTVRLRLSDWVEVDGVYAMVRDHLETGRLRAGERIRARMGRGTHSQPFVDAWIVANNVIATPPTHKQNVGTQREREARAKAHAKHLAQKGRKSRPPSTLAQKYAQTWVLFTTAAAVETAVAQYAARMAIEQTFRDWHHGWGLRAAAAALTEETAVARMVGIVCLAYRLHVELGVRFSLDTRGQARRAQWTVTNRVSFFWCAQHLMTDPGADWSAWLAEQWDHLITPDTDITLAEAA
ncbi:MAG TPA: transposase [Chloroflexota bacterium]|nr:transposase [Chloroflexota bacterium]